MVAVAAVAGLAGRLVKGSMVVVRLAVAACRCCHGPPATLAPWAGP